MRALFRAALIEDAEPTRGENIHTRLRAAREDDRPQTVVSRRSRERMSEATAGSSRVRDDLLVLFGTLRTEGYARRTRAQHATAWRFWLEYVVHTGLDPDTFGRLALGINHPLFHLLRHRRGVPEPRAGS
jgi:hypothetical protein